MTTKRKTGTKEWSDVSYNIQTGCSHVCRYCYARTQVLRFGRIKSAEEWKVERLKPQLPAFPKNKTVMFPTAHDLTPANIDVAIMAIRGLLNNGNKVLIVSKPHMECIAALVDDLQDFKSQVEFRFSIGTRFESMAKFWEPGAPLPQERIDCLRFAQVSGFKTSVSMEPFLEQVDIAIETARMLLTWVTGKLWET